MIREELQDRAINVLEHSKRLLCQWATGTGKSNVAIKFLAQHPGMTCLILVPEQNNIENWYDEFNKFGVSSANVTITCYASLHKYEHSKWGLLVFDEAPHMDTEKRRKICESVSGDYILALGAVIDEEERFALEHTYGYFVKSVVNLQHAIAWGIIPSPTVNICHISLNDTEKTFWLNGRHLTEKGMYEALNKKVSDAVSLFNHKATYPNKRKMLQAGSERKRFLGSLKENFVKRICLYLQKEQKRFLCFCSSIEQAESLGKEYAFTSHTPASAQLLDRFNSHEIDSLYVVGKLIEGQNLNDIEHGIITQLGGTSRITVQSIGRILRSKEPVIWIPVFDNTKDDSFLNTVTSSIPDNYIRHYKF